MCGVVHKVQNVSKVGGTRWEEGEQKREERKVASVADVKRFVWEMALQQQSIEKEKHYLHR